MNERLTEGEPVLVHPADVTVLRDPATDQVVGYEVARQALDEGLPVAGYCPMGCGPQLVAGDAGGLVCAAAGCPRPAAAAEILADQETEHVVNLGPTEFTVRHPLRERLDDQLLTCDLPRLLVGADGPPGPPGRYRAQQTPDGTWQLTGPQEPL